MGYSNDNPVAKHAVLKLDRSSARKCVGSVSYYTKELDLMRNTPNEKFKETIQSLCGVLGIKEIEHFSIMHRGSCTTYYRIKGAHTYYTAGDFAVVLASKLSARLQAGETLQK